MSSQSIRDEFHINLASSLLEDVQYRKSQYYYFLGRTDIWGSPDLSSNTPQIDSDAENFSVRSNALYFKRISENDVSNATRRYDWTTATVYKKWDHTKDMSDEKFYCINSQFNVYKCLDNNGGVASTVEPTGVSYSYITTSDGYKWKYMYNIPSLKRRKFLSFLYMPVQKALSNSFYNKGSIGDVIITGSGSGYTNAQLTTVTVSNTAVGSGAVLTKTINSSTGAITAIGITSGGSGYTAGCAIKVTSSTGTGAVLTPTINGGGTITGVVVTSGGSGYAAGDAVTATVGGAIIIPVVSAVSGSITSIKIIDPGAGYATTPTLTVGVQAGQTPGTNYYPGNSTAVLEAVLLNGKIDRVLVKDPGKTYPANVSTSITVSGDGSGAAFTPVIYNGSIVDIVVESNGIDYTYINLTVTGTGTGAVLKGVITPSDFQSDQTVVEQTTVQGAIYAIEVSNGGTNYSGATTVTVAGDGSGCTATPIIVNGVITKITVTAPGSAYNYAILTITDPNRGTAPVGSVDAVAYAILPPQNGHGYDAVSELFGNVFAISSVITNDTALQSLVTVQEYRQYGIIKNPIALSTGTEFRDDSDLVSYSIKLNTVTGLVEDEILKQGSIKYRVISFNAGNNTAILQKLGRNAITAAQFVSEADSGSRTYNIVTVNSSPALDKYTGDMLYISNENPFTISTGQNIAVRTYLKM